MNRFKFSLGYIVVLLILNLFHSSLEKILNQHSIERFVLYTLTGLFFSFFLIILGRVIKARKNMETAIVLLIAGMVFFFLTSIPRIVFKIGVFEFFLLGVLLAIEDVRIKLLVPLLLLLVSAVLVEVSANFAVNQGIFYYDMWRSILFGLAGYISVVIYRKV